MSALWTSEDAAAATEGRARGAWRANGVSIDSRTLETGDLYVALKGVNRDGHDFAAKALKRGACAAMVARIPPGVAQDAPLLIVRDTQSGLEALGRAARARTNARIAAVTGSAGKTTTKEMLRHMLARQGDAAASAASYNNRWGVPLSLARMKRDSDYGVFEIGMNHEGEIRALVRQVRPHVVLITTIAPAHLEHFGGLEAIADAKAEIFEGVVEGGTAILPFDNPQFGRLRSRAKRAGVANILSFGVRAGADARLISAAATDKGQAVAAEFGAARMEFSIGAPGAHIASNALAALLAVRALGADAARAAAALADFAPLKGRGARVALEGIELIDESYNANPASMSAALSLLKDARPSGNGRRVAVLGDMLELGESAAKLHRALAKDIASSGTDLVFLCGRQMRSLWDELPAARRGAYAEVSTALAPEVAARVKSGDVVLVKGSFASRMSVIVEALKARAETVQ